jgi:hypothetical protein
MPDETTLTDAENQDGNAPDASAGGEKQTPRVKTYTQDEVNRFVADRLQRDRVSSEKKLEQAREDAVSTWREQNGLTDDILQKLEGEDKTHADLKKIAREKSELEKAHESLKSKFDLAHGKLVDSLTRSAVLSKAAELSVDPESVYLHIRGRLKTEDDYTVTVLGDDGSPAHGSEIGDLITELLERKPFLKKATGDEGGGARPNGTGGRRQTGPDLGTREGRNAALKAVEW